MPTSLLSPLSSPSSITLHSPYVLIPSLYPLTLISLVICICHESCKYEISAKYEVDHMKIHHPPKGTLKYHPLLSIAFFLSLFRPSP